MVILRIVRQDGLAFVTRFLGHFGMLPVGGAFGGATKYLDGVLHTSLDVNF